MLRTPLLLALVAGLLPAQSPTPDGFDRDCLARVGSVVQSTIDSGNYAGASFVVLRNGTEAASGSFGLADVPTRTPMRRDTIVRLYSMTKAITAVAALTLVEADVLRLDADIGRWLPELATPSVLVGGTADAPETTPAARRITVRMLLNHTAGFSYDFHRDSPVDELYRRADLWSSGSLDEFLAKAAKLPLVSQPGERFRYSISDDVLGVLIERASKRPFADYLHDAVTGPLGMRDTAFDVPDEKRARLANVHTEKNGAFEVVPASFGVFAEPGRGFPAGGAGLFSTIDDYARFAGMLLGDGTLGDVRILSRKTMELATLDSLRGSQSSGYPGDGWGLICAVRTDPGAAPDLGSPGMLYWSGAATTSFFVDRHEGLVGVLLCQHLPHDPHRLISRFRNAVYAALQ